MKPTYPVSSSQLTKVWKIKCFLLRNLSKDYPVRIIAKQCATSEYFIIRRFPKITGLTVTDYKRKFRLVKGVKGIARGLSIKQVAGEARYNTANDFNRAFKAMFGVTPYQYIALHMSKRRM